MSTEIAGRDNSAAPASGDRSRWFGAGDRNTRRRGVLAGLAVVGIGVAVAGCGGGTPSAAAPAPGATAGTAATSSGSAAPNPNAPEINAAGDIPDNQVFVPFAPPGAGFSMTVPQGWAQTADGAATVFTDKFNSVRIESQPRPAAPDVASVQASDVPRLQSSVPGFALDKAQAVQRQSGPGVLLTYRATSAPNPVTGKSVSEAVERYTFWRGGTEVVLTLSGPTGADNVDPWKKITDSLRWQR